MEESSRKKRRRFLHLHRKLGEIDRVCECCEQIRKMASHARLQSPFTRLFGGDEEEQNKKLYRTIQKMLQ